MGIITVKLETLRDIKNYLDNSNPRKIAAIKALRADAKIGLKEAKDAIEKLQHEEYGGNYPSALISGDKIIAGPRIKSLVVDLGDGDIEVNLVDFELVALQKLQTIGLDACAEILDLVETLKAFADGKKIGVIDNDA